ncbi:hypothetical protein [uncultured Flavonifractor sp.]|uniref:hypothetical protein n=1 Tax=uncultured Flavonifractor sp. TaxID=1193534 RepID=UPI00259459DE|nr:hypothetical protein [uncultured Flavonifractor sp.]
MRRLAFCWETLRSKVYWKCRSIRARAFCWYMRHIWEPLHPEPEFSEEERRQAEAVMAEVLAEPREEEEHGR